MRVRLPLILLFALACLAEGPRSETVRGKLIQSPGKPPAVETADHKLIALDGDDPTRGVLNDKRLSGFDLSAKGHFVTPGHFLVDPIHTRAVLVYKTGRAKYVTYWCDTCSIRSYSPGLCWCCQEETTLDLRDPGQQP